MKAALPPTEHPWLQLDEDIGQQLVRILVAILGGGSLLLLVFGVHADPTAIHLILITSGMCLALCAFAIVLLRRDSKLSATFLVWSLWLLCMVAGLAHELNTPIGNAVTIASTLSEQADGFVREIDSSTLRKSILLGFAEQSVAGSQALIRNLERAHELIRNFKQVAVDQTSESRRTFLLDQMVNEIIASITPALKRQPVSINTRIDVDLAIDGYPGTFGQVLINLINNAVLHAFEGREHGQITISGTRQNDDWLRLIVEDNGIGIQPGHLDHIFEPFFTTKLGKGGSGLGLSIIYNIVTALLGGEIACQSTPGKGTRFTLLLPTKAPVRSTASG